MSLIAEIKNAFEWRKKPIIKTDSLQLDKYDLQDIILFTQHNVYDLKSDFCEYHYNVFYLLSAEAFCYYLPAILILSIEENASNLLSIDCIIGSLDRSLTPEWWDQSFIDRWTLLTEQELIVIQNWLLWLVDIGGLPFAGDKLSRSFDTLELLKKY